jgi:hypothetical protein
MKKIMIFAFWLLMIGFLYGQADQLSTPQNLEIIGCVQSWTDTMIWDVVDDASFYTVRAMLPDGTCLTVTSITHNSFAFSHPAIVTGSSLQVKANGDGVNFLDSEWSVYVDYGEPLNRLDTPTNLQVCFGGFPLGLLTWDAVENATGYEVRRHGILIAWYPSNSHAINDVPPAPLSSPYTVPYTVRAVGDCEIYHNSLWSEAYQHTVYPPIVYFPTPKNLEVELVSNFVKLSWSAPVGYDGTIFHYIVFVNGSIVGPWDIYLFDNTDTYRDLQISDIGIGEKRFSVRTVYRYGNLVFLSEPSEEVSLSVVSEIDIVTESLTTALVGNYPNPFNPTTTISFALRADSFVNIDIYNISGQRIKSLLQEHRISGNHHIVWDGTDDRDRSVGSGIYFYKMTTNDFAQTKKMILMK